MNDRPHIVLVTGGSGFVGSHVILQLRNEGHEVRTTVRSLSREAGVRAMLKNTGEDANARLSFFEADLERDGGWREAVDGCDSAQSLIKFGVVKEMM